MTRQRLPSCYSRRGSSSQTHNMARTFSATASNNLTRSGGPVSVPPFTVSLHCYITTNTDSWLLALVDSSAGADNYAGVAVDRGLGQNFVAVQRGSAGAETRHIRTYTTNQWIHVAAVFDSSTNGGKIYVDTVEGAYSGSSTTSTTQNLNGFLAVGAFRYSAATVATPTGRIADVGIWNVALTTDEIAALARRWSPQRIRPGSLVPYWPLYGNASPEPDYSGGAFNLTIAGTLAQSDHAPVGPPFGFDQEWQGAFVAAAPGGITSPWHYYGQQLSS